MLIESVISFPCPGCRDEYDDVELGRKFCQTCAKRLNLIDDTRCDACGGPMDSILDVCTSCMKEDERPWAKAYALFQMRGYGQQLIHQYKYNNRVELAKPFGYLAADLIRNEMSPVDLMVPMPLHWTRYLSRGYNQAELLVRVIASVTGIPWEMSLRRRRMTRQQARLSREERRKNIKGVFSVKKGAICRSRTILLVDDVLTTGSTLTSAAKMLMDSGAANVNVLILARGH